MGEARVHKCSTCGKEEPWGDSWSWFGSYRDLDDGVPVAKFCSVTCAEKHKGGREAIEAEIAKLQRQLLAPSPLP